MKVYTFIGSLVAGLAFYIVLSIYLTLSSPLRSIPGPFITRFTRLWFLYRTWRGQFERDNIALHRKYGEIVRYGPQHYSFNSTEAIDIIYGRGTEYDKSSWYEAWNAPGFKTLFTEPNIKVHGQLRRKFQATYSMSSLTTYEGFANHCIALLKQKLDAISKADITVDMAHWFLCYAADTVAMITYSRRMGFLDKGEDVDNFFKNLHGNLYYNTLMGIYAELHPLVFSLTAWLSRLNLVQSSPRMSIGRFTADLISEKRKLRADDEKDSISSDTFDEDAPRDFLSKFLDSHEYDPTRFTEHDINVGLIGNVIAGSDTTAAALSAILYCLLKHPLALSKLREEVDCCEKEGRLSTPATFKEAHSMPYLQAVIQESQRLYPGAGLPIQRVVPLGGANICGRHFPAGTVVGVNAWVVHLNDSIFGDDAESFRPERWLDTDKAKVAYMQKYFMAFGTGSRTCIGKNISLLEMSKLVPELLRYFDFELDKDLKEDQAEWRWINYWLIRPATLPVKVRLRTW